MAGTTHKAGAAGPWAAAGPDDDAEDEEAEPAGDTAGEEDDELEDPEGAPGMSGDKPAAMRALAASTPEATLAFHSAVSTVLNLLLKALHSGSLM